MTTPHQGWAERVRASMAAPSLSRSEKKSPGADPKWAIGDALLAVPEEHRDAVALEVGLTKTDARSYARVAQAWPAHARTVQASWTTYRVMTEGQFRDLSLERRQALMFDGMVMRQATKVRTKKDVDRRATEKLTDDDIIDEIVMFMISQRSKRVIPLILERLNASKEGRKLAQSKRSTAALRQLDDEIRLIQKAIKKAMAEDSPGLRFMQLKRRLLDTEVNVEQIALLFSSTDEDQAADADGWRDLAQSLKGLATLADKVSTNILSAADVIDVEGWDEADAWTSPGLSVGGDDDDIVDAELVDGH